ncbi:hypothetical protein PpBr36_01007 [Pyricularia pennisetigena]|uniref:hypothetical protein n=1 Tax=Pyricularia pennisetigena TaxID=1578925 RepID=UPI0011546B2D|nr:hypothetical protein PpBr36_01007 [Pyricularia pennisetigena]TLS28884.1 hypothetical protein PpBr36_01007 [Pyricularia pennisetigena]
MATTASTKELTKALTTYLSGPSPAFPLPDDITHVIEAYRTKHDRQDDAADERLQEELLQLYQKLVHGQASRIAPFIAILRSIRPKLWTSPRAAHWFDVLVDDVLDHIWQNKALTREVYANYESVMKSSGEDRDGTANIMGRCLERWMQYSHVLWQSADPATRFKENRIRDMMLGWGKKSPKLFMEIVEPFFTKAEFRTRASTILCEFIQSQPPHLHLAAEASLLKKMFTSLQRDKSTTAISLTLTALTMLLPNFPSSLVPHLPTLFNIYARLLFWDRERSHDAAEPQPNFESEEDDEAWEVLPFSPEMEGTDIPQLLNYFTILYGLYPINFTEYIRKPQRWLRHVNATNPNDIDVQPSEMRYRSERFRQVHLLHPNFYTLTVETEKTDFGRWLKSEPAVVVAECMALCVSSTAEMDHNAPVPLGGASSNLHDDAEKGGYGLAQLSASGVLSPTQGSHSASWRQNNSTSMDSPAGDRAHSSVRQSSQSSHPSFRESFDNRASVDSPTLPPLLLSSPSQSHLQDLIRSNKIKSSIGQSLANDSVPSLSLSHQESISERPMVSALASQHSLRSPLPAGGNEVAILQRQIMVLRNDLHFERYMKHQHMAHIGELRRMHMKEAATEAETQNLIMNNRNLKHRLDEAKRVELQVKKDSEKSRVLAHKWEAELSTKLRNLKTDMKAKLSEIESLQRELNSAKEECEKLRAMVGEAEVKELNAAQAMQSLEINMAEMTRLRAELDRLLASERDYQAKQMETEARLNAAAEAEHRAGILEMKVTSLDNELQVTRDQFQSQIVVLNAKLAEALKRSGGKGSEELKAMFEGAIAASRAKQVEVQKQYNELLRRHTKLQSQLLEKTLSERVHKRQEFSGSAEADAQVSAIVGPSLSQRARTQKASPDPDSNDLSRLGSFGSGTSTGTIVHRPDTPSKAEVGASSTSPQAERIYPRGGVQNTIRKERKDKKKDDQDKKDKKPSGIRSIRGFG